MAEQTAEFSVGESTEQHLQEKGWAILYVPEDTATQEVTAFLTKHPGLKDYRDDRLEPDTALGNSHVLVYDPERATVMRQVWQELPRGMTAAALTGAVETRKGNY